MRSEQPPTYLVDPAYPKFVFDRFFDLSLLPLLAFSIRDTPYSNPQERKYFPFSILFKLKQYV